jgi:hypothetical protein
VLAAQKKRSKNLAKKTVLAKQKFSKNILQKKKGTGCARGAWHLMLPGFRV